MKRFLKTWMLPISMTIGVLLYVFYRQCELLHPYGAELRAVITTTQPWLIFLMLYSSFCKVQLSCLRLRRHFLLPLLIQCVCFLVSAFVAYHVQGDWAIVIESFMICMICPTATAAVVVTGKLGGDTLDVTAYTILINIVVALLIPAVVPILHPHPGQTFCTTFAQLILHIFPMLICPLFAAALTRNYLPRLHRLVTSIPDFAFYLWAISLSMCLTMTARSLYHNHVSTFLLIGMAAATALSCILQFWAGRCIGARAGRPISGGQSLGQKNTAFAIWMAYTFLDPVTSVAGGFYSLWHNIFNSWQLARHKAS